MGAEKQNTELQLIFYVSSSMKTHVYYLSDNPDRITTSKLCIREKIDANQTSV